MTQYYSPKTNRRFAELIKRDGEGCCYCGHKVRFKPPKNVYDRLYMASIEHVVDKKYGGPNHIDNFKLAHAKCNSGVQNWTYAQKIERMKKHKHKSYAGKFNEQAFQETYCHVYPVL